MLLYLDLFKDFSDLSDLIEIFNELLPPPDHSPDFTDFPDFGDRIDFRSLPLFSTFKLVF